MKGCYIIVLVVERNENKTQGYALLAQLVEQRTLNLGFRPGDGVFFVANKRRNNNEPDF